ncbi:MAG: hypothetical protein M3Z13_03560 [Candidatus Dormibacteraeota bacterium]|nr:hypothetical protein [Candidatus Dormibacteraeota bacterium]
MVWVWLPLLWIHVLTMSFWLGSAIFSTVLGGQDKVQSVLENNALTRAFTPRLFIVFPVAILLGVLSGIALGIVFGRVTSFADLFGTAYGLTMLMAFLLVVMAMAVGPAAPPALKPEWVKRVRLGEAGIVGAFTCMMLMRVGL